MGMWKNVVAAAALAAAAASGQAETLAEAQALLTAAQEELSAKGMEGAASSFNQGGRWRGKSAYVVLVDFSGHMYAHADNMKIVGKNMLEAKDAAGKPFIKETIQTVKTGKESLVTLRWADPNTKKISNGQMVARRVEGKDAYVGVAFFE